MACKFTPIPGGFMVSCTRGSDRAPCKENGCHAPSVALCDWPLGGGKKGKTCSRPVCAQHRRTQPDKLPDGDTKDYCPTHDKMSKQPHVLCPKCHMTSFNPSDIEHRFCGKCNLFHDDPAPPEPVKDAPTDGHPF